MKLSELNIKRLWVLEVGTGEGRFLQPEEASRFLHLEGEMIEDDRWAWNGEGMPGIRTIIAKTLPTVQEGNAMTKAEAVDIITEQAQARPGFWHCLRARYSRDDRGWVVDVFLTDDIAFYVRSSKDFYQACEELGLFGSVIEPGNYAECTLPPGLYPWTTYVGNAWQECKESYANDIDESEDNEGEEWKGAGRGVDLWMHFDGKMVRVLVDVSSDFAIGTFQEYGRIFKESPNLFFMSSHRECNEAEQATFDIVQMIENAKGQ